MNLLLKYLSSCWFLNNPADLVPPRSFMWKNVSFYIVSGCIVEGLISDPADGTLEVLGRFIMAFSSIATLLLVEKKWHYFNQLYTSIFVCENFIMTLAVAAEMLDLWMTMEHIESRETINIAAAAFLVAWYIAIVSYIFRQFFNYRFSVSLIFAFSYFVLTYGVPMLLMDI
ncbi:hypothetical protein NP590_05040 [Methylomonas sp. SURF-2]|uniref:Uncharacterized protein n=1 Tax=Methylomonas subterranea TaxID=2952225 RepID=A0ABT1TDD3_9GAMM|nr:hypothetical protein [Methylomonas sp. SURF-2]MCQ8103466.1 hypothetical protein [Methylomonas sp. SURF-2]